MEEVKNSKSTHTRISWDNYFMNIADVVKTRSLDTKTQVGAVLVSIKDNRIISVGYNAQPKHIDRALECVDGLTLPTVRHAEKSALMGLLRAGISPVGSEMFVSHSCCLNCAIDIVDAGITKVYYEQEYRDLSGVEYLQNNQVQVEKIIVG